MASSAETVLPIVDLAAADAAAAVDRALHRSGFLLLANHGVPQAELDAARAAALRFFHLPAERKAAVRITGDAYRGWVPPGAETNANAYGIAGAPADLKESFVTGPPPPADEAYRAAGARWFLPNRMPADVPGLAAAFGALATSMERLGQRLLGLAEEAVGVPAGTFAGQCRRGTFSLDANWYPPGNGVPAREGQFRVGPHTDYGVLTLLDRQPGLGGLQIQTLDDAWVDAPHVPGTLTVNTGDLMSHWSGGRWRSTRHRVLPPPPDAPLEELLSLVFFHNADHDAVITPLGVPDAAPVRAGDYLAAKLAALLNGPTTGTELVGVLDRARPGLSSRRSGTG